jgi:hypothetical protein
MLVLPFLAGLALAPAVAAFALSVGFGRDRSFYPTILVVVASYYALFAVMGGDGTILAREGAGFLLFCAAAAIGFRTSLWIVVAALAGHGLFDAFHSQLIANPGTPHWWPAFCLSFDVAAAACLAVKMMRSGAAQFAPPDSSLPGHLRPRR